MAKQAEGCAVLRLSKAAAGLLKVLRPGQNVPCSSFEAQEKQFEGPMGRYDGKASGGLCGAEAFESCCGAFGVLRPDQNVPCSSFEAQ